MNALYRSGLFVLLAALPMFSQQPSADYQPVGGKKIGSGKAVSSARIADPNELVYVNGQIVKMSQLTSLVASLDSLEGRNLHIPVTSIDGTTSPVHQLPMKNSKCPSSSLVAVGKEAAQAGSCPASQSSDPSGHSKDQR